MSQAFYSNLYPPQQPNVVYTSEQHQAVQTEAEPLVQQPIYSAQVEVQSHPAPTTAAGLPQQCGAGGCAQRRCCKKFNPKKCFILCMVHILIVYLIGTIKSFVPSQVPVNHANIVTLMMLIATFIVGGIGMKKNRIVLLGVFMGMMAFIAVTFALSSINVLFFLNYYLFRSFFNVAQAILELTAFASMIFAIIAAVKQVKIIKAQLELPIERELGIQQPASQSVQQPVQPVQPVQSVPQPAPQTVQIPSVQIPQMPVYQPVYPVAQVPQPVPVSNPLEEKYKNELVLLREMGFTNNSLNIALLTKHNGHLQSVVQDYLQSSQ